MAEHTPGPWIANLHHTQQYAGRTFGFVHGREIVPIAAVTLGADGVSQAEGRANARLIAAAPDLLAALDGLMIAYERNCFSLSVERTVQKLMPEHPYMIARKARAKARGETP